MENPDSTRALRILMIHSRYQQKGGEDVSTLAEASLLRRMGHHVDLLEYDNKEVDNLSHLSVAARTIWSRPAVLDVRKRLSTDAYDILHVQNYLPLVSPAVLLTAASMGVATVQALRNYRLMCVAGNLFRDGRECHECIGSFAPWRGVRHACYRKSVAASATLAGMIVTHKALGTWHRHTDALIAVSSYVRDLYVEGGFPADRIFVKANVSEENSIVAERGRRAIYTGRLAEEKGVDTLISAWRHAKLTDAELLIVGSGPQERDLRELAIDDSSISFLGHRSHNELMQLVASSRVAVAPSRWSEPFGRTAIEAFSVGTPVLAAAKGGLIDIVGGTAAGALFEAGDVAQLSQLMKLSFDNDAWWRGASEAAREAFSSTFSPAAIAQQTIAIYNRAMLRRMESNRSSA